jgi:beta-lactamase class D
MPLTISRVTPDDFNTLVPIEFAAFADNGAHTAQLGFNNAESIAHAKTIFLEAFTSDPADAWLKVTDEDANGRIVAASNWKIYPTYVKSAFDAKAAAAEKLKAEDVTWHSDARQKEDAVTIMKEFFATRYRRISEAHVRKFVPFDHAPFCFPDIHSA